MIHIDFETRSKLNIKKVGAPKYAEHPSTTVLVMLWQLDHGPVEAWYPWEDYPWGNIPFSVDTPRHLIYAHNSMFERCIWHYIMVPRFGWHPIAHSDWRCTAARAAAMALPRSLEKVGSALGLAKQKDAEGHTTMMKLARPRKPSKNNPAEWHFSRPEFSKLVSYCADDVKTEVCLSESPDVYELSKRELALWQLDQKINIRGIPVDIPTINAAIKLIERWSLVINKEVEALTKGAVTKVTQRDRLLEWVRGRDVKIKDAKKQTVMRVLERPNLPSDVRTVLKARQSLGKTSTAKLIAMRVSANDDGRCRDTLMYHGAGPGRWTGRRIQPQNYPKVPKGFNQARAIELIAAGGLKRLRREFGDPMQTISYCLRGMIKAPEGMRLYGADYSKIELCVLVWLANQSNILRMLREGEDVYVEMATKIYGCLAAAVDDEKRDIGKRGVLGCGYQCGWKTFKEMVYLQGDLVISEALAKTAVEEFRSLFDAVLRYWRRMNDTVMDVVRTGESRSLGLLRWGVKGNYLHCRLPSGRLLSYYKPEMRMVIPPWEREKQKDDPEYKPKRMPAVTYMGVDATTKRWIRESTYGGKLTENVTQAIARDLLAEAMPRAEAAGYPLIFHVHDEEIALTDEDFGSVSEFEDVMSELPLWAEGCPVKAEGWTGFRYAK